MNYGESPAKGHEFYHNGNKHVVAVSKGTVNSFGCAKPNIYDIQITSRTWGGSSAITLNDMPKLVHNDEMAACFIKIGKTFADPPLIAARTTKNKGGRYVAAGVKKEYGDGVHDNPGSGYMGRLFLMEYLLRRSILYGDLGRFYVLPSWQNSMHMGDASWPRYGWWVPPNLLGAIMGSSFGVVGNMDPLPHPQVYVPQESKPTGKMIEDPYGYGEKIQEMRHEDKYKDPQDNPLVKRANHAREEEPIDGPDGSLCLDPSWYNNVDVAKYRKAETANVKERAKETADKKAAAKKEADDLLKAQKKAEIAHAAKLKREEAKQKIEDAKLKRKLKKPAKKKAVKKKRVKKAAVPKPPRKNADPAVRKLKIMRAKAA